MLNENEKRILEDVKLFWKARGRLDFVKAVEDASPETQQIYITAYQAWVDESKSGRTPRKARMAYGLAWWMRRANRRLTNIFRTTRLPRKPH